MTTTAIIILGLMAAISTLLLKGTVRLLARKSQNGWDNALAYLVVTVLLAIPVKWIVDTRSLLLIALIPPMCWVVQTVALKVIYEVKLIHAWLIGMVHAMATTFAISVFAVVVAYIKIGEIISDPLRLLEFLLKLIGIELPFGQT